MIPGEGDKQPERPNTRDWVYECSFGPASNKKIIRGLETQHTPRQSDFKCTKLALSNILPLLNVPWPDQSGQ